MALTAILFFGSAIAIYLSCEFFVNGVEWVGRRLKLTQNATGTILAAFGTALPESVVTLVAVAFGNGGTDKDIGVGAALGGPLVLSTLAYATVGLALLGSQRGKAVKKRVLDVESDRLSRDQGWFLIIFLAKSALGLLVFAGKGWLGLVFLAAYAAYVWLQLRERAADEHALEPLKLRPKDPDPPLGWALLQTLAALAVIFAASRLFVGQLGTIGMRFGVPPQLVALLLSPIATELPEIMNAIIWVRQGKERLALANISGAMMIQATIPTALGLFFTSWLFDRYLILAAAVTIVAILLLLLAFRRGDVTGRRVAWSGLLYLVFAAGLFFL